MREIKIRRLEFRESLYRRRYLIPNLVTLGNLFCGFLMIIYASTDRFEKATIAIAIALLLDGLDGRVARRLNATSKFGLELDSFADLVSFGVGPAMLMYYWCFQQRADEFGVAVCFVYVLCAASRLARFNITAENLSGFEGLPTPGAAGTIAAVVHYSPLIESSYPLRIFGTILVLGLAWLMVSRIPFWSIKKIKIGQMRRAMTVVLGAAIAFVWYNHEIGLLLIVIAYCLSGPVRYGMEKVERRRKKGKTGEITAA